MPAGAATTINTTGLEAALAPGTIGVMVRNLTGRTAQLRAHPALEDRAGNRFDRLFDRQAGAPTGATAAPICRPWTYTSNR